MASSTSSEPSPAPLAFSLLDLPALVVSTHILPRLPASAIGSFACTCKGARDAAHDDERLWKLLCARRLARWSPGAVNAPVGAWRLRPLLRRCKAREGEDDDSDSRTDDDDEGEEPARPPTYRDLYSRLLGWSVPGALLGPLAASADAALGPAPLAGDNRERGPIAPSSSSGPFQDPLYWGETRRETAARRPFGSLLSFEPDFKTGSVVGYALSPALEMSSGFLRTPLLEVVPARRMGQRPWALCLRFPQAAAALLARNQRNDAGAAASDASAAAARRRRRARRHFEAHRASLSVTWGDETDCRDRFDFACQAFLEAEATGGSEGESSAEGSFFSGLSSSSSPSASPPSPRRPAVLLGPCEAWCNQSCQEAVCRSEAVVASRLLPPPQRQQHQQPRWRGGGRGVVPEEEGGEEEAEEVNDDDGARFGPNVAPAVQGIGRAAPPLGRLGDGSSCCDGGGGEGGESGGHRNGSHCGCGGRGVSALPRLSGDRTAMDLLLAMGGIGMEPVGKAEGEERGETVLYEPMEKLGLAPPPRTTAQEGKEAKAPTPRSSPLSFSSPLQSQLEGVWKGDYGAHGVEVVRISSFFGPSEVDAALEVHGCGSFAPSFLSPALFVAVKLTGDANVPAGSVSFALGGSQDDCAPETEYSDPEGVLSLNGSDGGRETAAYAAALQEGRLPSSDLLQLSERDNGGLGAPLSLPEGWHCEHDLRTADPSPLSVRGHWPACALVSARGFSSPTTIPAQVVSVSRDCFFVAWGGGMRKLSLFTRLYANEMQWAGPEGAR